MHLVALKSAFYKRPKYLCYSRQGWFIGPRGKAHGFQTPEKAMAMVDGPSQISLWGDWTFDRLEEAA